MNEHLILEKDQEISDPAAFGFLNAVIYFSRCCSAFRIKSSFFSMDTTPWLLIVFLFLGIGAGLSNAFRLARKYGTELERREQIKGGTPPREEDE